MINWPMTAALVGSLLLFGCSTAPQQETPPEKETVPPTPESKMPTGASLSQFISVLLICDDSHYSALCAGCQPGVYGRVASSMARAR